MLWSSSARPGRGQGRAFQRPTRHGGASYPFWRLFHRGSDLLRQHLGHCVHRAMTSKNASEQEKVIKELVGVFRR